MLRLLILNEGEWLSEAELLLVCQDRAEVVPTGWPGRLRLLNLGTDSYNKPRMCNAGVGEAARPIVALLDSDRVSPPGYFQSEVGRLRRGFATAPRCLMSLDSEYTDEEISEGHFTASGDFRRPETCSRRKNGFSGNTLMYREDYQAAGGMDESFEGYGFADNDMVATFRSCGFTMNLNCAQELHLHHPALIHMGETIGRTEFRVYTLRNGIHFHQKWGLPIDSDLRLLAREIQACPPTLPRTIAIWRVLQQDMHLLFN